ncbi:MAG: response regulator, partial [Alphaproteobacteria bacterium]|nr:response regulator [Alphaproteobacteria bacterium]
MIDTTEKKKLEVQFSQSQKMQAVGQLAGGIAHDFNNLLTAMIGFCDLLLQRYQPGEQSFADIMQIKQNANRGARLVRQLLAFSRQQTLQPRVLDVTDVLSELSNLLHRLLGESIELKFLHGRDLGKVKVDQGQLEQVIINLAVNSRDAMPRGGKLSISTRNCSLLSEIDRAHAEIMPAGDYVMITVSDNGIGMPQHLLDRIFDPFFTTKEVGSGTGLGLATVYGIIKQTGGFIFADSEGEGKGSVFTIYLQRHDGPEEESSARSPAERPPAAKDLTGGGTILLVEDEDPVRLFGARALRSKGYRVIEARNGEIAIDLLNDEDVDLLITDMVMPKVDGPTVIAAARRKIPELPVICISGYTQESVVREVESIENVNFLAKPFSLRQLAGKVKEVLEERPPAE